MFPATFGLACCAIEMMAIVGARVDVARFGSEAFRASPRQADLMIISGRVSIKMAPVVRRIYDQMLEPKWTIAMGACSSSMGVFNNYAIVPADKFMPVDIHVPGCPPRPEALMHGILKLRTAILSNPDMGWRTPLRRPRHRGGRRVRRRPIRRRAIPSASRAAAGWARVPDATGLELIAQELRDRDADERARHELLPRAGGDRSSPRRRCRPRSSTCAGRAIGFMASVHGVDYFPEEPRLGVHYELLDMSTVDRITVKTRVHASTTRTCRA